MLSLAVMAMASCSKEQSSFNIEDVPGKAKIMGTLSYDAGQSYINEEYAQLIQGAAGVRVKAQISNSSFKSNSTGYTTYETKTDENGNYTIEVPAVPDGTSVEIIADPFFATYSEVVGIENNKAQIENREELFKVSSTNVYMRPDDIEIYDAMYYFTERAVNEADKYIATFIVKVGQGYHRVTMNENNEQTIVRGYTPVNNKDILVRNLDNGKYYAATTTMNGEATFKIPTANKAWQKSIKIEVIGYIDGAYNFHKREWNPTNYEYEINSYSLKGVFKMYEDDKYWEISYDGIAGVPAPECKVRMIFQPFENEHGYTWDALEWDDDSNL